MRRDASTRRRRVLRLPRPLVELTRNQLYIEELQSEIEGLKNVGKAKDELLDVRRRYEDKMGAKFQEVGAQKERAEARSKHFEQKSLQLEEELQAAKHEIQQLKDKVKRLESAAQQASTFPAFCLAASDSFPADPRPGSVMATFQRTGEVSRGSEAIRAGRGRLARSGGSRPRPPRLRRRVRSGWARGRSEQHHLPASTQCVAHRFKQQASSRPRPATPSRVVPAPVPAFSFLLHFRRCCLPK